MEQAPPRYLYVIELVLLEFFENRYTNDLRQCKEIYYLYYTHKNENKPCLSSSRDKNRIKYYGISSGARLVTWVVPSSTTETFETFQSTTMH
jgi:hypothetical protein